MSLAAKHSFASVPAFMEGPYCLNGSV